jgi:hypothetical protein
MKADTSIKEVNRVLERESHNIERMFWACNRLAWMQKFHKAPKAIIDALITKATAIMDGTWCGDEPEETVIDNYIKAM